MEEIKVPQFIDSPPQFLFLEIDDLMPMFLSVLIGLTADLILGGSKFFLMSVPVGALMIYFYIGFKRNQLPGTLKAFMYFHTGLFPINKKWTNGFLRRTDE